MANAAAERDDFAPYVSKSVPQRPNPLHSSYVRPKGRTLQRSELFRSLLSRATRRVAFFAARFGYSAKLKIRIWTSLLMVRWSRPLACIRWMKSGVMLKMRIWINSSSVGW